jgi:hypothetical protein
MSILHLCTTNCDIKVLLQQQNLVLPVGSSSGGKQPFDSTNLDVYEAHSFLTGNI